MPKTSVHEYRFSLELENKVRSAWQVSYLKAISVTQSGHHASNGTFGTRVPSANAGHPQTAIVSCEGVRHYLIYLKRLT